MLRGMRRELCMVSTIVQFFLLLSSRFPRNHCEVMDVLVSSWTWIWWSYSEVVKDRGVCIQRRRLWDSVQRTDPLRRHVRWHDVLRRRTYSVNKAIIAIDGHHSLIRWRMVIHGGNFRMIVYLSCSTNNKALTVYHLFKEATGWVWGAKSCTVRQGWRKYVGVPVYGTW